MLWPARVIGAATAVYGVAVIVKPEVLAGPTGLVASNGTADPATSVLSRGIAARDVASGLAMALAPTATGVRLAGLVRIGADLGDAVGMGLGLPDPTPRKKAAGVAGAWAGLTALTLWLARKD